MSSIPTPAVSDTTGKLLKPGELVLGLDCSTQSFTVNIYSATDFALVDSVSLSFQEHFPEFGTDHGVIKSRTVEGEVTTPSLMFVAALDKALSLLRDSSKCDLSKVVAVSGSGQQHGTVYWRKGAFDGFHHLELDSTDAMPPMTELLKDAFSFANGPIWMDASTTKYCRELEEDCGGVDKLAAVTGAMCYERFGGIQVYRRMKEEPSLMRETERVSLVSSMMASLFLCEYAPIDLSDACGTGLVDFRKRDWGYPIPCAHFPSIASGSEDSGVLLSLLGGSDGLVDSHSVIGHVHSYLQARFGFSDHCVVVAFSGDNPCSLAGMHVSEPRSVCVSLGTSSTVFAVAANDTEEEEHEHVIGTADEKADEKTDDSTVDVMCAKNRVTPSPSEGWVFASPLSHTHLMCMAVFKNGALLRERIKKDCKLDTWDVFEKALAKTPAANDGRIGFYFDIAEITPSCKPGIFRFDADNQPVDAFEPAEVELRAVIEFQFVALRNHLSAMGVCDFARVYVTGGASENGSLMQILSDVFGAKVLTATGSGDADAGAGATRGAALRALHGVVCHYKGHFVGFEEATICAKSPFSLQCEPDLGNYKLYTELAARASALEEKLPRL